jgi:hypothetical protein
MDLDPPTKVLRDGRVIQERSLFEAHPKRCFYQTDLYSTFFRTGVSDAIERRLFGDIDTRGATAVRAFAATDAAAWREHFETFFEYIDIQKLRTPKGLAWLKAQYPYLDQNELMQEMLGIRMLHTTIWSQCVREIVSAEDSAVKFIITDHPVTIYNRAMPPSVPQCAYPNDPEIALKASQTLFPLSRNHCLILTNLEYAKDPTELPTEKRTFARNFRSSLVRTDKVIRVRRFNDFEVSTINRVLKARARRYVAAGMKEWLQPEDIVAGSWADLAATLLPPRDQVWGFGGEMFVGYDDGRVHYQDAFGRTEKERDGLKKVPPVSELAPKDACGCGSGRAYRVCCSSRPPKLRPIWTELSIRERNICFYNGVLSILQIDQGKDWVAVRRGLTEDQIRDVYFLYEALWPLETDLLALLPKPDGRPRAVYTGSLHPDSIGEFAIGASAYFGEVLVENPFVHAGAVSKDFKPTEYPRKYHLEFLKSIVFYFKMMPLIDLGLINLIPSPTIFDYHLRDETMAMAQRRVAGDKMNLRDDPRLEELFRRDARRDVLMWPKEAQIERLRKEFPKRNASDLERMYQAIKRIKFDDPIVALQDNIFEGDGGGQLRFMQLSPNFEITMYLAQATGAALITDSALRWREILQAAWPRVSAPSATLRRLAWHLEKAYFLFPDDADRVVALTQKGVLDAYPRIFADTLRYLRSMQIRGPKPNFEDGLAARFVVAHASAQKTLQRRKEPGNRGRITCMFPPGGIQNNSVSRLLLMSNSEHHTSMVPMAFYIESAQPKY